MIDKATSASSIQSMLRTMASYQAEAAAGLSGAGIPTEATAASDTQPPDFVQAVRRALGEVNDSQVKASNLREAYESGEPVPLTDVVIAMQKSSLAFEATLQVRNKVMKAYEDILNMPV